MAYLIITIICFGIDFILSIIQIIEFCKNEWLLRQACMLLFLIIFGIMDVIYFIWFETLKFSLPEDIISSVRSAIIGSIDDLKLLVNNKMKIRRI